MHLIRLLLAGSEACKHGHILVHVGEWRDQLLAIKHNEWTLEEVLACAERLEAARDRAYEQTKLPEHPDEDAANALVLRARCLALASKEGAHGIRAAEHTL